MGYQDGYPRSLMVGVPVFLLVMSWMTTMLRIWIKKWVVNSVTLEDWLMLAGMVLFTVFTAIDLEIIFNYGLGQHIDLLSADQIKKFFMYWFAAELIYNVLSVVVKLSIAMLLLRLAQRPVYRIIIKSAAGIYTVAVFAFFFMVIFQCLPPSYLWDKSIEGRCHSKTLIIVAIFLQACICAATDFVFALLPMVMIWNSQMDVRTKIPVVIILGLGIFASAVNIVRFAYIQDMATSDDVTYQYYPISLWTHIEAGIGIIAASLATLRPLLRIIIKALGCRTLSASHSERFEGAHRLSTERHLSNSSPLPQESPLEMTEGNLDIEKPAPHNPPKMRLFSIKHSSKHSTKDPDTYSQVSPRTMAQEFPAVDNSAFTSTFDMQVDALLWDEACERARVMARSHSCNFWDELSPYVKPEKPPRNRTGSYHISEEIDLPGILCEVEEPDEAEEKAVAIFGAAVAVDRRHSD